MDRSRREFIKIGAAFAVASQTKHIRAASSDTIPATPRLRQFSYGDIALLDGPMREQFEANHKFYKSLDEDSLLKPFRQRAGLAAPGRDMGGWYSWAPLADLHAQDNGFAPGHSFGQYISGLARDYAATGDPETQKKIQRLVNGFAAAISPSFWDDHRFPAYTYDKISIGLLDAHEYAAERNALAALDSALDSVLPHLPPKALSREEQYERPHKDESFCWDEPYTLPENFFLAWQRGAGSRYRDLGVRFLADDWYWNPLASGQNVLPGKHAYSHVNAMSSAMQAYFALGSEKHFRAACNGFEFLRTTQSFATGGWGPDEHFRTPGSGQLGESLTSSHAGFETPCGSYAHFKITRYLLRATGDSRYGDSMEKVLYNCILGAKPIQKDGHGFYYSDYNQDASKTYHPYKWHCCTGTFSQISADYGISSYFHDGDGIYINLYVPSRVSWMRNGKHVFLTQRTLYPLHSNTSIEVSLPSPDTFPIHVRVPAWSREKTSILVNGQREISGPPPGGFVAIKRNWKSGDRIEIEFDMPTVLECVDQQHKDLVAPVHGPLALFSVGPIPETLTAKDLSQLSQASTGSSDWQVQSEGRKVCLRPFAAIQNEHYRLYLKV